ncbi:MAG TPA: ECF-type sigma factor [Pyrinomonadaceae bacterium]|nr:ECF-type sigma factor [Pyrinomonadaceae bacterium]
MQANITKLLNEWNNGNDEVLEQLTPFVYDELRRLAGHYLRNERNNHTLQATALAHEAYLQLREMRQFEWNNRAHFIGVMANLMRRVLVDHAREHNALKRSGGNLKVSISHAEIEKARNNVDLVELDEVLEKFSAQFPRQAKVVELKFFGGLTIDEIADVFSVNEEKFSTSTIERD